MELQQQESTLSEERTMSKVDFPSVVYSNHGELHLTTENNSLVNEIKILIRKLWN